MKLWYMRTSFVCLAAIAMLVLLSSCFENTSDSVSQVEVSETQSQSLSQTDRVPERYTQYEGFASCSQDVTTRCTGDDVCTAEWLDQCMMEAAAYTGDGSAVSCDEFLSEQQQNSCRYSEVFSQALQARDASECSALSGESMRRCSDQVTMILASQLWDISLCESLSERSQVSCRNNYLSNRAMREMDVSLCDDIEMYFESMDTEEELAIMSDDMNFDKQMCIEQVEMMQEAFSDSE